MTEGTIGKRIQALRKERGLTQKQLAETVGVTPQAVSKWETDESCPDITALPLLAEALGVSVDTLLGAETRTVKREIAPVRDGGEVKKEGKSFQWVWHAGRISGILFGLFVLLAGVLVIVMKTKPEWFTTVGFWDLFWPSAIIFFGLSGCLSKDVSGFSLGVTALGVLFLLKNLGVIEGSLWPIFLALILILVGVSIILRQFFRRRHVSSPHNGERSGKFTCEYSEAGGFIHYTAKFGDDTEISRAEVFNGGEMTVSFGDYTLDLREVREFAEDAVLEVSASFGEATVLLPTTVRADVASAGSFSGKETVGSPDPDAPFVLRINASVSFGSLSIEYGD